MKLIIQIPCLNEADTLHRVINDLPHRIEGIDVIETFLQNGLLRRFEHSCLRNSHEKKRES